MLGNFQDGSCPGKIQFGSGWWFNDHIEEAIDKIKKELKACDKLYEE